jgi:hypothetical protein
MRLSDWQSAPPSRDILAPKVLAVIEPVVVAFGGEADPVSWIVWGDDPATRYTVLVPVDAGLLVVHVRVNVPQEGPRASGKLVRWSRVQVGELAMEMVGGHRMLSFQVETNVLRGTDDQADAIAAFALGLFASIDGRPFVPPQTVVATAGRPANDRRGGSDRRKTSGADVPLLSPPKGAGD